jgi:hypothetical protein
MTATSKSETNSFPISSVDILATSNLKGLKDDSLIFLVAKST